MMEISHNPVYRRFTRQYRPFMFIIVGFALLVMIGGLLSTAYGAMLVPCMCLASAIIPLALALYASRLTAGDAGSDGYQVMRLTGLSSKRIVEGYVAAALYSCRLEIPLVLSAIPGTVRWVVEETLDYYSYMPLSGTAAAILQSLIAVSPAINVLGHAFMAAALGVMFGLWLRNPVGANFAAIGIMLLYLAAFTYAVVSLAAAITPLDLAIYTTLFITPYLIGLGAMRLARRWV